MRAALRVTAMNDGSPATQACGAGPTSSGDRRVAPLDPSTSADGLFAGLIVSARPQRRSGPALVFSAIAHVAVAAALILVPLLSPAPPPVSPDYIRALIYDPPPPPPPPLPKGSPLVLERPRARVKAKAHLTDIERPVPAFQAPIESAAATPEADPGPPAKDAEPHGSPSGADSGVPEGMEDGVEGGVVGGVPGGVLGGVIGGTGQGPVRDFDRAPRLLRQTRPRYPEEAFVKRVEGTVLVEFVIDAAGRVVAARILHSVAPLDAAALEAVREWAFTPAFKHGVPVASVARAPIVFRIY